MYSFHMRYSDKDELNLKVLITLNRCQQSVMRKGQREAKEKKITMSQWAVLEMLYHKGDLKVGDIIEKSLSTIGNISLVIDNLAKQSLLVKKKCNKDKRVTYVSITKEGRDVMEEAFPEYLVRLDSIMSPLEEQEKKELARLLKKLGHANSN